MKFQIKLFAVLIFSLMIACDQNEDTNSPTIENFTVDGLTEFDFVEVLAGNSMTIAALITEDIENASFRIQVVADFTTQSVTPLSYDQEFNATDLSVNVNQSIDIPASTVGGPYKVILTATDAAERVSEQEILISIKSPTQPTFNITPDPSVSHNYSPGDTIHLGGLISDGEDIVSIHILCEPRQQTGGLTAAAPPFYDGTINLNGTMDTSFEMDNVADLSGPVVIPSTQQIGSYRMVVSCTDSDENTAFVQVDFDIF